VIPTNAAAVEQLFPDRRSRISCNQAAPFPELAWISQPEQLFVQVSLSRRKKILDIVAVYCYLIIKMIRNKKRRTK
tara:strand:- start:713 stop:940 length:228 start_codon:yes stop_codon:yes gene_type:complete